MVYNIKAGFNGKSTVQYVAKPDANGKPIFNGVKTGVIREGSRPIGKVLGKIKRIFRA
jgi:hypothetical protein